MRALALGAVTVHVAAVLALVLCIGFGGPIRLGLAFAVVVVISVGWTIWLYRQDEEAALRQPPAPAPVRDRIGAR